MGRGGDDCEGVAHPTHPKEGPSPQKKGTLHAHLEAQRDGGRDGHGRVERRKAVPPLPASVVAMVAVVVAAGRGGEAPHLTGDALMQWRERWGDYKAGSEGRGRRGRE